MSIKDTIRTYLVAADPPPAVIFVDGDEFIVCDEGDNYTQICQEVINKVGGEVALYVYKSRHGGYLRERLSITADVPASADAERDEQGRRIIEIGG